MEHYSFLTEDILKAKTHWGKGGQYNAINQIIQKYPSPRDFKNAVRQSGDKKSMQLINSLDDNAPRNDYVDFLQNVYMKYSSTGKHLLSGLAGLGIGAAVGYLSGKAADPTTEREATNNYENGGGVLGSIGKATNSVLYKAGEKIGNNSIGRRLGMAGAPSQAPLPETGFLGLPDAGAMAFNYAAPSANKIRGAQVVGGAAGMLGGTIGAHGIQSWRQKKIQNKIDALKNG